MYTNPSNIIKTMIKMLESNIDSINSVIKHYDENQSLTILEGMRASLPMSYFPSLEIEPTSGSNNWYATRSQMPRYSFNCTLTVANDNEDYGVEYISTIATTLVEIMTDPQNLQLPIVNEVRWDSNNGLCATYITDSLVEGVTYNANKEGTIRTVEFDWFALIHEPFPDSHFWIFHSNFDEPTELRPREMVLPE